MHHRTDEIEYFHFDATRACIKFALMYTSFPVDNKCTSLIINSIFSMLYFELL